MEMHFSFSKKSKIIEIFIKHKTLQTFQIKNCIVLFIENLNFSDITKLFYISEENVTKTEIKILCKKGN